MNFLFGTAMGWAMKGMAGRFLQEALQARTVAQQTLQEILNRNGATEWGRKWGLDRPTAAEAFQSLPVTSYQDYAPYVERIAAGEQGILTAEPVTYLSVTSGTTGPQKLIPVTQRQTRTVMKNMLTPMGLAMRTGHLGPMRGRMLQIMTEQINGMTAGGIPKGAATSSGMAKMGKMMEMIWTSPLPVIKVQDQVAARYLHLLFALGEERLWTIVAFFPSTLLFTLRDLNARAPELLRDLADGTITPNLELDPAVRAELTGRLRPNLARARALAKLYEQGTFTVKDIWPSVGTVISVGSGTFRFYVDQLQPYLGGVRVFSSVYAASEAAIGLGLNPDQPGYVIAPSSAYHEFLPEGADRPVSLDQVEVGQTYEMVLTTFAGLTRYRLGDQVQVLGRQGEAPIVEFIQRKGQVINIVGEKTNEVQIATAFEVACRDVAAPVLDYIVTPDPNSTPTRYLLLIEALNDDPDFDAATLLRAFDGQLRQTAPDYGDSLRMGELGPMAAVILRPGTFERYRDQRVASGASAAQVKVPHVVPDPGFAGRYFLHEAVREIELERVG